MDDIIGLSTYTYIGCAINNQDYFLKVDIPISKVIVPTSKQLHGIRMCKLKYGRQVVSFIRLAKEMELHYDAIKQKVDTLNTEYKHLEYGRVRLKNPFVEEFENQKYVLKLISYCAMLSVDKPKLHIEFDKAIELVRICLADDFKGIDACADWSYSSFGKAQRGDDSIFDRAVHHYKYIRLLNYEE